MSGDRETPDVEAHSPRILWEGPLFVASSLALANREIGRRLLALGHHLTFRPTEPDTWSPGRDGHWEPVAARAKSRPAGPFDIHLRHRWPPDFRPPESGRLVLLQHWEFGSLPRDWIAPLETVVDELWVATESVRDGCLRSGVPAERVKVLPFGVDPTRFHPKAPPLRLRTGKTFKFLFVGGTIRRKGVHFLLEAYGRTFSVKDDVCLVIKDLGGGSFYKGQTAAEEIRRFQQRSGGPEVLYLDETIAEEDLPGLYTACDCLVHPYLGEGFGLPIAEAMAAARPVIVTGHGAALDFCDESCAFLIPAQEICLPDRRVGDLETVDYPWLAKPDVDHLARLLRLAVNNPEEGARRGHLARERIRSRLTWDHTAHAASDLLHDVAARPVRRTTLAVPAPTTAAATPSAGCLPVRWGAAPFNYSGYARVSRMLLPALVRGGAEIQLQPYAVDRQFIDELNRRPAEAAFWTEALQRTVQRGLYVCFHPPAAWNGYRFFTSFRQQNPGFGAYVGFTMFETDRLPRGWAEELASADQVWVPSQFNVETFIGAGVPAEKVRLLQPGLDLRQFHERPATPYEIPGKRGCTFLSVFQWTLRKGWDILLAAYLQAFERDDDVSLVIRAYPGQNKSPPLRRRVDEFLRQAGRRPEDCPPIILLDQFVPEDRMPALYAAADAYVLPSRGEAWGVPYMEAMALGLPTIGTRWGGQLDFMDDDNSYLIDVEDLEPVAPEQTAESPYYEPAHRWARPSVAHTAHLLREVFDHRQAARERGARARAHIHAAWGVERSVAQFRERCGELAASRRRPAAAAHPPAARPLGPPVVWNGPLDDPSGYADEGRQFILGLDDLGIAVLARPVTWSPRRAELDPQDAARLARLRTSPLVAGYVHVQHVFASSFRPNAEALATVGRTMFETDRIPEEWVRRCNLLDEIWVPSQFNVETFARAGVDRSRLHRIPGALDPTPYQSRPEPLDLDGRRGFNFLSVFDWTLRKGWDLLLRAWAAAFRPEDDVALLLKVSSSLGYGAREIAAQLERFAERSVGRSRRELAPIHLLHGQYSSPDLRRLFAAADAYVMPSRGEGWGRPYMEAMALGRPTIGTAIGGNTEFMTPENSFLIDAGLEDVPEAGWREAPAFRGHRWASPSVDSLTEILRRVVEDREGARRRGLQGREEVLARFDRRVVARAIADRLAALGAPVRG